MSKQKVYLAGGFRDPDWQGRIKREVENLEFYDPKAKEIENGKRTSLELEEYGTWDLHHIKQSDIVFVYIESSNPAMGSLVEIGYAKGLGKTVVLVLELRDDGRDRYYAFAHTVADVVYDKLEDGIEYLKLF